jgi:hypothetical protein
MPLVSSERRSMGSSRARRAILEYADLGAVARWEIDLRGSHQPPTSLDMGGLLQVLHRCLFDIGSL